MKLSNKNLKENFLENIKEDNTQILKKELKHKDSISSNMSENTRIYQERIGYILCGCAVFCNAFATFFTKVIQRVYPNDFHTFQFLWLRAWSLIALAIFHHNLTGEPINKPFEIKEKFWFFIRTNVNFFGVAGMTAALWYLRTSTAQIIASFAPIMVFVLAYFILHEKLHMRYLYGAIACLFGSTIIILNERKINLEKNLKTGLINTFKGICFSLVNMLAIALINTANKILVKNKVCLSTQMFYTGLATLIYSSIFGLFTGKLCLKIGYLGMCIFHGFAFYGFNLFNNEALIRAPLSKLIIMHYMNVIYLFILGFLFLDEPIFITDLLGAGIIIGYMTYNSMHPLPNK